MQERDFPSRVTGPWDFAPLMRELSALFNSVMTVSFRDQFTGVGGGKNWCSGKVAGDERNTVQEKFASEKRLYADGMTGHDKCLSILEQTPAILADLLSGASSGDLQWQPSPERWSIGMVVAQLADVEVKGFRGRFEAMATRQEPFLASYDQGALFRSGGSFDAHAELEKFRDLRADNLRWMRGVPADAYTRTGKHEEFGTISFEQLLNEFAFHDLGHIRQIMELYRSHAFYPNMGSFQSTTGSIHDGKTV
jgi:hypothetical protein